MTMGTAELRKEIDSVYISLTQIREQILLLSAEEAKLLLKRAELEKQLFPEAVKTKTQAILELLRHKRTRL